MSNIDFFRIKSGKQKTPTEPKQNKTLLKEYKYITSNGVTQKIFNLRQQEASNEKKLLELKPLLNQIDHPNQMNKTGKCSIPSSFN